MRSLLAALILPFALPAAAQDMRVLFSQGMKALDDAGYAAPEERDKLLDKAIAAVALNVSRFLHIIRARKQWSLRVGASLLPDTIIGVGSDEHIIYIPIGGQLLPFRREQEDLTTSGVGVSAWIGGEYQYPIAQRDGGSAPAATCPAGSTRAATSTGRTSPAMSGRDG